MDVQCYLYILLHIKSWAWHQINRKGKKKLISIIVWNKNNHSNNIKVNKYNYEQGEKSRIFMFDLNIYILSKCVWLDPNIQMNLLDINSIELFI